MKAVVVIALVAAVLAVPAQAKAPGYQRQINALNTQIRQLRTQVAALQTTDRTLQTSDGTTRDWAVCMHAVDVDQMQQQLHLIYLLSVAVGAQVTEPAAVRYDDQGACQRAGIPRS